jgi:hypothetical protein
MTESELISEVSAELTQSCALPYSLNEAEIKRIIKKARRWFYDNYQYAVEDKFIVIPQEVYENAAFTTNRTIQLPECVQSVYDFREMSGMGIMGQVDRDFSESKMMGAEIFLSPFQGDNLVYRTAMYSYFDLAKAYDLQTIAYSWNKNTRRINVLGRTPRKNTYVTAYVKIAEDDLYNDELFIRYVLADAKINLGRTLQVFNYNLPGGVQINFDGIKQDGVQEMQEIKEQIDGENSPSWFLQWN